MDPSLMRTILAGLRPCHRLRQSSMVNRLSDVRLIHKAPEQRLILGIESSCDDSCASVVSGDRRILSSIVTRQDHSETKGIHPLIAVINHHRNMPNAISKALKQAGVSYQDIDAIAVTLGPGMRASLAVGLTSAKTLASVLEKPIIYVHHMQAHALTPLLTESTPPEFPFLTLLVSGGHTMLVLVRSITDFKIVATTTDDSIGDAFDKIARALTIPWASAPGAALEAFAADNAHETEASEPQVMFPLPLRGQPSFSYSGLKSAVLRHIEESGGAESMSEEQRRSIARAFQVAACQQLEDKLAMVLRCPTTNQRTLPESKKAKKRFPRIDIGIDPMKINVIVCSGGVASNQFLRTSLRKSLDDLDRSDVQLYFPPLSLCTDNAAMIAFTGHLLWNQRTTDYTLHQRSKWSLEDLSSFDSPQVAPLSPPW